MQSRMEKYGDNKPNNSTRIRKNNKLYEEVYDDIYRDTTYRNMEVIDSAKEINVDKLKDMIDDTYKTRQNRTIEDYSLDDDDDIKPPFMDTRKKIYDINEIINDAKDKRTFIEEAKEKQKYTSFVERNKKYDERFENLKKEEQEVEDLIDTMSVKKIDEDTGEALDLFNLRGDEDTIVTTPIEADTDTTMVDKEDTYSSSLSKTLAQQDKTFYTDSNIFTKNDFEDFSTLSKEITRTTKKRHAVAVIVIIILVLLIALALYTKFVLNKW